VTASSSDAEATGTKIRLTADQFRATAGLLIYALDASERRHHDQEWLISNPATLVLDLDCDPDDVQYDGAVAMIAGLADKLATPSRAAVPFTVDEQLLLAAMLDYAFYKDGIHDRQQWPIEAAAEALYPNLEDAPNAAQYDRALRLLYETRGRLEPLPDRPDVRPGDCLHAWDLEDLEENEGGYQVVAVDDETLTVRDADGADHTVSCAAIAARDAGVVHYFGDFETQPDPPGFRERREREQQEWARRTARYELERRARAFAEPYCGRTRSCARSTAGSPTASGGSMASATAGSTVATSSGPCASSKRRSPSWKPPAWTRSDSSTPRPRSSLTPAIPGTRPCSSGRERPTHTIRSAANGTSSSPRSTRASPRPAQQEIPAPRSCTTASGRRR